MNKEQNEVAPMWVKGELQLAGILDNRIIDLLSAIDQSGSLNQAAKQMGLSYKGAWQIIERVNNSAPKTLITATTGGSKGGGSCLTESGRALLELFKELQQQHHSFLAQLNRNLATNPDIVLLLQRLVVKTTVRNQLFGCVTDIRTGSVNVEIMVTLKGGQQIATTADLNSLNELELKIGSDAVLLIESDELMLVVDMDNCQFSARNCLSGKVLTIQMNNVNVDVTLLLPSGETLVATMTQQSVQNLDPVIGQSVWILFKSNVPMLGIRS
jgi:molybdate transport system regulatory protein